MKTWWNTNKILGISATLATQKHNPWIIFLPPQQRVIFTTENGSLRRIKKKFSKSSNLDPRHSMHVKRMHFTKKKVTIKRDEKERKKKGKRTRALKASATCEAPSARRYIYDVAAPAPSHFAFITPVVDFSPCACFSPDPPNGYSSSYSTSFILPPERDFCETDKWATGHHPIENRILFSNLNRWWVKTIICCFMWCWSNTVKKKKKIIHWRK